MLTKDTIILQKYHLVEHQDLLWVLLRLGCVFQSQVCRLLYNNMTDNKKCTELLKTLEDVGLIELVTYGNTNIVRVTHTVSKYFDNKQTTKITGPKLKKGSLILEKYLRLEYYKHPVKVLRDRLDKTNALFYLPLCQQSIALLKKYKTYYQEKGLRTSAITNEIITLSKRYDCQYNKNKLETNNNVTDLYLLETINCFITRFKFYEADGRTMPLIGCDIYNINSLPPTNLSKYILTALTTLESIFDMYTNGGKVFVTIYSHDKINKQEVEIIYNHLAKMLHTDVATLQETIKFVFFDTKSMYFPNVIV